MKRGNGIVSALFLILLINFAYADILTGYDSFSGINTPINAGEENKTGQTAFQNTGNAEWIYLLILIVIILLIILVIILIKKIKQSKRKW